MSKRKKISAEESVENILNFVYDESGDENSPQDEFMEENEKISENSLTEKVSNDKE